LKKIIVLLISLLTIACSSSDSVNIPPVVGMWSHTIPSVQCTETFTFNSNNTFSASSLDEISNGTYVFETQENSSNRHAFSFTVTSDNQQFDCEGDNTNDIGTVYNLYAEFPDTTVMNWYLQPTGGTPVETLNKN